MASTARRVLNGDSSPTQPPGLALHFIVLGLLCGVLAVLAIDLDENGDKYLFIGANYLIFAYLLVEIWRVTERDHFRAFLQPPVIASIVHFIWSYIVPGVRYFTADGINYIPYGLTFVARLKYRALNVMLLGVLLASFAMWRGYNSRAGERIAAWVRAALARSGIFKADGDVSFVALGCLTVIAIVAWLFTVRLGVFGYSADATGVAEARAVQGWLKVATDGGSLTLLVLAATVYTPKYRHHLLVWIFFGVVLLWQVALGFLSGFKSQVVMPFIICGFAYYAMKGRIPLRWGIVGALMLVAAFRVVGAFRAERQADSQYDGTSLTAIANTVVKATVDGPRYTRRVDRAPRWHRVLSRQDLLTYSAEGIAFEEAHGVPPGAPDFLGSLVRAPINAYVPRLIWSTKDVATAGRWFNIRVLGAPATSQTAIGMGPVAFLNFAGGFWAVAIVFFFIGILQRVVWETFRNNGMRGWVVYLCLISSLAYLPSNVSGFLAGFLRQVPFVLLAQYLVLRPSSGGPLPAIGRQETAS